LLDEENAKRYDPDTGQTPEPAAAGRPSRGGTPTPQRPGALTGAQVNEQVDKFLLENNVFVRINESQLDRGAVRAL
jgi:hypothetical protein